MYLCCVYFSWHFTELLSPFHDIARYQLLTDTLPAAKKQHNRQLRFYGRDWNMKQDFVVKCAMRNVGSSNEKVERFPVILLMQ